MRLLQVGVSAEMLRLAIHLGHEVIGVVDPALTGASWRGVPAANHDTAALERFSPDAVFLAIDSSDRRAKAYEFFRCNNVEVASLMGGCVSDSAIIGDGATVQFLSHLSDDCVCGKAIRLNVGANVMHDVHLGDFVTVAPGAVVLGRVRIGEGTYVGANATILPNVTIGAGCTIGAGSVVARNLGNGQTVKGVPAR